MFVSFAAASVPGGTCYSFSLRVRVDGDNVSGTWREYTDGHGSGTSGTLQGFRN